MFHFFTHETFDLRWHVAQARPHSHPMHSYRVAIASMDPGTPMTTFPLLHQCPTSEPFAFSTNPSSTPSACFTSQPTFIPTPMYSQTYPYGMPMQQVRLY